jgi:hypothetical protein
MNKKPKSPQIQLLFKICQVKANYVEHNLKEAKQRSCMVAVILKKKTKKPLTSSWQANSSKTVLTDSLQL